MKVLKHFLFCAVLCTIMLWAVQCVSKEIVIGYTGPLSGPGAEYGQDVFTGVDMAVKDLNAAGGIMVKGQKYTFKLEKLDDRLDPTQAVNNARRFKAAGAVAVWSPVFNCIAPLLKINEEKGNEFIVVANSSTPKVTALNNKLVVDVVFPFTVETQVFADQAWTKGWRTVAMLVTLGAYGDEWRESFKAYWEKIGGTITIDKPANYYTETDFSSQITAVMGTNPDAMLIGGPSGTTALLIEQARSMGFKGGFIIIDQAKADYMARLLKGIKYVDNSIGMAAVHTVILPASAAFEKRYTAMYKRMNTWETIQNYTGMHALAKAIAASGTVDNPIAIRAAFPKVFPLLGDKYPVEYHGISDVGRLHYPVPLGVVENGNYSAPTMYIWWAKSKKDFDKIKKISKYNVPVVLFEARIDNVQ
ncbi:MAG: ABC transporter substrate-binding protein [Candidatus Vecturithrix sp.]|jgi:branched-chain amino acid transport system substrate-binding protein|nr:ABC transporter substrate-binding protein [Candidatus Vecturithrix sp.]